MESGNAENTPTDAQEAQSPAPRPHVWITSLRFNDGTTLEIGKSDIVVVVGPNNAGKSAALREIHSKLVNGRQAQSNVLSEVTFAYEGTPESVEAWLEATSTKTKKGGYRLDMVGVVGSGTGLQTWKRKEGYGLQALGNLMAVHLNTEARLTVANPTDLINFVTEVATQPLHRLYNDEDLEKKLDKIFERAFRRNLIVNRGAGRQVLLHVGQRPTPPPGKDRQSNEYRFAVNSLPATHEQGDGIRAFVGVIASVLAAERDIMFIDEPEAFLHPPQANMLGRVLAEETPEGRQLVVATHSSDFLRGVLDHSSPRVRVVRIQRDSDINHVTELKPELVRHVWGDPLLRYSKVLDGLFHDGVVVCEGDADCRFYGALLDAVSGKNPGPDLLFVYGAGKSRIATIVSALRAIGVPVRVVTDFDVLRDEGDLRKIIEALGAAWSQFESHWKTVNSAINQRRAELSTDDVRRATNEILANIPTSTVPDSAIKSLRAILRRSSAWADAKQVGKAYIPSGQQTATYDQLSQELKRIGLFIVEVGEMESFCRSVAGHGPNWVTEVLQRDLVKDPDLADARAFASAIGTEWN